MNMKSNMDQIVGTIVGAASGDALGARHEFHPPLTDPSPLEMGSGGAFDWRKGQWTDDTEQGIVLLRQLVQGHDLLNPEVLDRVARGLVDWGMGATDIGMQTRAALTRVTPSNATATNVMAAAQAYLDNNPDACGNGSLMRTSPVAIAYLDDEAKMIEAARTISRLTHPHADALDACAIWCVAIRIATLENRLDIREAITRAVDDPDRRALWLGRIEFAEAAEAVSDIPDNGGAVGALQAAWRAVSVAVSAEDAIEAAVRSGNDADTVGAIAGALAGARFGCSAIPARWRRYLNGWPYSSETLDLPMQYRQLLTFAYLAGTGG
jgi:ADP-ribosylglycohydrolase